MNVLDVQDMPKNHPNPKNLEFQVYLYYVINIRPEIHEKQLLFTLILKYYLSITINYHANYQHDR